MSNLGDRLVEERKRLGLSQEAFGALGGVSKFSQLAYEKGTRKPDSDYLEAIAMHDVDVAYVLTGHRALMAGYVPPASVRYTPPAGSQALVVEEALKTEGTVTRELTPEEAALLDNYNAADEKGRAAARGVLDALAQPKRANG